MDNKTSCKETWSNIVICKVEDADELLVKKCPDRNSNSHKQFVLFEREFNEALNYKFERQTFCNTAIPKVGEMVMVRRNRWWHRGIVEERFIRLNRMENEAQVFLWDHGESYTFRASEIFPIVQGDFMCIPYQVKRVRIRGVLPISLDCVFQQYDLYLKPLLSNRWDNAAKKFVRKLKASSAMVELEEITRAKDGSYFGNLVFEVNDRAWELIKRFWKENLPSSPPAKMSLAEILVRCRFAVWKSATMEKELNEKIAWGRGGRVTEEVNFYESPKSSPSLPALMNKSVSHSFASERIVNSVNKDDASECSDVSPEIDSSAPSSVLTLHETRNEDYDEDFPLVDIPAHQRGSGNENEIRWFISSTDFLNSNQWSTKSLSKYQSFEAESRVLASAFKFVNMNGDSNARYKSLDKGKGSFTCNEVNSCGAEQHNSKLKGCDQVKMEENSMKCNLVNNSSPNEDTIEIKEISKSCRPVNNRNEDSKYIQQSLNYESSYLDRNTLIRLSRVHYGGSRTLNEQDLIIDESEMREYIHYYVCNKLEELKLHILRIQNYFWPIVMEKQSVIAVGEKSCGKTFGYVVPLVSNLLREKDVQGEDSVDAVEPSVVIICHGWERVKKVTDIISYLSPPDVVKVIHIWGALGKREEDALKIRFLGGSDILVTTLPCFVRLLQREDRNEEESTICAPFQNCSCLVIDDADQICSSFFESLMEVIRIWKTNKIVNEESRNKYAVITSSSWSKYIFDIYTILDQSSNIIISSHLEAAVFSQVSTNIYYLNDSQSPFDITVDIIKRSLNCKIVIYTYNEQDLGILKDLLKGFALYAETISSADLKWQIERKVYDWHQSRFVVFIVCDNPFNPLHRYVLHNADMIINIGVPPSKFKLGIRYSVMLDYFPAHPEASNAEKRTNLTSHIILFENMVVENLYIISELPRIGAKLPVEVLSLESRALVHRKEMTNSDCLCHFMKAYGECKILDCEWRHHFVPEDIPISLPVSGGVGLNIIKIVDASRYLVRISEFSSTKENINLESFYKLMFGALQEYYGSYSNRKSLELIEKGRYCAVQTRSFWARARIVSVDFRREVVATVFLIDEGIVLSKEAHLLFILPEPFQIMPQLITEVYLCDIKPSDEDFSWTLNANNYISNLLLSNKRTVSYFGKIAFSLKNTLWLSPVTGRKKVEGSVIHQRSVKSSLLAHKYGSTNENHITTLCQLYSELNSNTEDRSLYPTDEMEWFLYYKDGATALFNFGMTLSFERAENLSSVVGEEIPVEIEEIVSPLHFYAVKSFNIEKLRNLEDEIQTLQNLKAFDKSENEVFCLAKFTDGRYYRGKTKEKRDADVSVFFMDHGETVDLPYQEVRTCPSSVLTELPPQAFKCVLDHIAVVEDKLECATEAMIELIDSCENWNLKVNRFEKTDEGLIYYVELTEGESSSESCSLWRNLVSKGLVTENLESSLENEHFSCSDNQREISKVSSADLHDPNGSLSKYSLNRKFTGENKEEFYYKNQNCEIQKLEYCSEDDISTFLDYDKRKITKDINSKSAVPKKERNKKINYRNSKEIVYKFVCTSCGFTKREPMVSNNIDDSSKSEKRANEDGTSVDRKISIESLDNNQSTVSNCSDLVSDSRVTCESSNRLRIIKDCLKRVRSENSSTSSLQDLGASESSLQEENLNGYLKIGDAQIESESKVVTEELSSDVIEKTSTSCSRMKDHCKSVERFISASENISNFSSKLKDELKETSGVPEAVEISAQQDSPTSAIATSLRNSDESLAHSCIQMLHPQSYWKQDNEKLYIKLSIPDVTSYNFKFCASSFWFRTDAINATYEFKEELYTLITPELCSIKCSGLYISVIIAKEKHAENWPRLLKRKGRVPWLHPDLTDLNVSLSEVSENEEYNGEANPVSEFNSQHGLYGHIGRPGGLSDDMDSTSSWSSGSSTDLFKFG